MTDILRKIMIKKLFVCCFLAVSLGIWGKSGNTTVVISLDGCRWDYPMWYDTPMFDFMAEHGLSSGLIPSFPSKTFPNHYTLATGLYPDHHGIVANSFLDTESGEVFSLSNREQKFDPKYYGGEPIWITAKRQGIRTAVFYWPGSDVPIQGQHPDIYYNYDDKPRLSLKKRIEGILAQLSRPVEERPQLIMAYLEQPDAHGHDYGPQSKLTRQKVLLVDSLIGHLYKRLRHHHLNKSVNLIVLSDHGMAWVDSTHAVKVSHLLKSEWVRDIVGEIPACIYANPGCTDSIYYALKDIPHARVWRKNEVPSYLHYGTSPRIGDVVVLPDIGYVVYEKKFQSGGTHGYDPNLQEMHAMFRAIGPDIPHRSIPHFPNVCIYNYLCRLLGIEPAPNDGEDIEFLIE